MSEISHEDIGALKQAVTTLTDEVKKLREDMATVNTTLAEIQGGKKALWALLGAAGILGGGVTWALQHIKVG